MPPPEPHDSSDDSTNDEHDAGANLPMSMSASMMLTNLPKDASQALKEIDAIDDRKGTSFPLI
jgi:ubiquitin-like protein ATG12